MEDSIEQPVVSASGMVELGSFKVTMKTALADLYTHSVVRCGRNRMLGNIRWFHDSSGQENWPRKEDALRNDW